MSDETGDDLDIAALWQAVARFDGEPTMVVVRMADLRRLLALVDAARQPLSEKKRSCALTTLQLNRLDAACHPLSRAFPDPPCQTYLVGSAERGEAFRDVDVRLMLSDEVWADTFARRQHLWEAFCLAWSSYLGTVIGLPVDFQVQQMTAANAAHSGPRNPLGHDYRRFAGHGDATVWDFGPDPAAAAESYEQALRDSAPPAPGSET